MQSAECGIKSEPRYPPSSKALRRAGLGYYPLRSSSMMHDFRFIGLLLLLGGAGLPLSGAEYRVTSAATVTELMGKLRPGDTVVMANGEWKDQAISFPAKGTERKPITLR